MPDNRQAFTFAPAKRAGVGLFVGVAGGTGSGNTDKLRLVAYYLSFDTPAA